MKNLISRRDQAILPSTRGSLGEHRKNMIKFIDLARQQQRIRAKLLRRIEDVLDHGQYILGPEVALLEERLCRFSGAKHALSCSNGTDALMLALMALDVKPGDAILCPSFTFAATAEVIPSMGAVPVFVDIDPATFNIDPDSIKEGIVAARNLGLTPKGIIAVDLYGLPADYDSIGSIASENNMWVIADSAQSFGAKYKGKRTGSIADITTTSFFPAKPFGGYGDGGAVFCRSDEVFSVLRSLRVHGMGSDRYDIVRIGMNGRLDSIQAAVLLEKLDIFEEEAGLRQEIADFYSEHLCDFVEVPTVPSGYQSIWALYTVKIPQNIDRSLLKSTLEKLGVPTMVYYPIPLHRQVAYKSYPRARGILKNSDSLSSRVLSLPMHPYLTRAEQLAVVNALKSEPARIVLST